jgi:hypothetical protein
VPVAFFGQAWGIPFDKPVVVSSAGSKNSSKQAVAGYDNECDCALIQTGGVL